MRVATAAALVALALALPAARSGTADQGAR